MERMLTKKATAAGCTMEVTVMKLGEDFQICLAGGEKPHIGCVVQAVPRESLTGDGSWSATSSVWNRTGHKDEVLCGKNLLCLPYRDRLHRWRAYR